jgi:hypothetical protein
VYLIYLGIRQLQCILLKVALLLGVEIHENVTFDGLAEPPEDQSISKQLFAFQKCYETSL